MNGFTPSTNNAPTICGKLYHSARANTNVRKAVAWATAAQVSPFGGAFCRFMAACHTVAAEHHRKGGFFRDI